MAAVLPPCTAVVMGVPVDDVTLIEAVDRIAEMVERGRSTGRVHQVATVNVDFLVKAAGDQAVLEILQRTDLAIPDGMPVVWAANLVGTPLRQRTTGVDLVPALVERAAQRGHRVVLFGAAPGVAARAAAGLIGRYPGAAVEGIEGPPVAADGSMDPAALDVLRAAEPDVLCVALGNPKQERWIARYGAELGAPVSIGIGGTLDFLTGVTTRAPVWIQRSGFEWVHRAFSEPRRLIGRYARDLVVFGPGVLRQGWRGRRREAAVAPAVDVDSTGSCTVRLLGPAPATMPEIAVVEALARRSRVTVDTSALDRLDNATIAAITGLVRAGRRTGARVETIGLSAEARRRADALIVGSLLALA